MMVLVSGIIIFSEHFGFETTFRSIGKPWNKNNDS